MLVFAFFVWTRTLVLSLGVSKLLCADLASLQRRPGTCVNRYGWHSTISVP